MGAFVLSSTVEAHITVEKVAVVDTSGAGDAFLGALAFYISNMPELPLQEAVQRSCAIATISVQRQGTQSSYPERADLPISLFAK
jgi:ribokinase